MYFTAFLILYLIITKICVSLLRYQENKDYYYLKAILSSSEIDEMQSCTEKDVDISTPCFQHLHKTIISKIKTALSKDYMSVHHARFSNNNNNDGQTFHRDIKPMYTFRGPFPEIYTAICYLDQSQIFIGNKEIHANPGDVVIFNSLCMHKAGDISPFTPKNRRVLQLFHCFFDPDVQKQFYAQHAFCEHARIDFVSKYIYYFIDFRWWAELTNITFLFQKSCDSAHRTFVTMKNEEYYLNTIDNVRYYRNL